MKNKIILCITLCTSLLAQDSIVELNQISVTETKQEEQNLTLANSISKKDKNEIDLDQVIYQKDLLNSLSGVRIEQTSWLCLHKGTKSDSRLKYSLIL